MIGHKQIIESRMNGFKPTSIFFEIGSKPIKSKYAFDDPELSLAQDMFPTVFIEKLNPKTDVRFAAGCMVHIHAKQIDDCVIEFAERLAKIAPKVIVCSIAELINYENGEWYASSYA